MSRPHDPSAEPSRATPAAEGAAAAAPAPSRPPRRPNRPRPSRSRQPPRRRGQPAPAEEKRSSGEPAAQEPEAAPVAVAVAEAEDPGAAAGTAAAAAALAEPSPGRPRASLLAAAGITGTLLIAVPFLVLGLNDDDAPADRVRTESVGGATLDPGLSGGAGTAYRAETASPSPTASASASASPSTKGQVRRRGRQGRQGTGGRRPAAPKPEEKPATEKEKKTTKKKTTKKKSAAATARSRANAASSQSRVLLKNVTTGQCADVPNYGNGKVDGPVNQYPCNGTSADNQLWDLVPHKEAGKGPGGSVLFLIRNSKDGLCLDLPNYGGVAGGTRITEYPCQATRRDNQYYWLDRRSDGTYWIRNLASRNLCLNVAGPGTGRNDAALQIGTCNDSANDDAHWYFTRK